MKEIKATVPFAGVVSMAAGEIREVSNDIAADLIATGYAEEVKRKQTQKKGEKDESE
ncbi:MAG: hypothetical protein HDT30_12005 [Clostridiales bacterium]|nr:hypothetical protein [Clostridiales bacterium]